jgi:predicted transcriptional regulator of viral defense system
MINYNLLKDTFEKSGSILKTNELKKLGLNNRQIKKLVEDNIIRRIKQGYYEMNEVIYPEEFLIAKLFPNAVIYLESALNYYGYTDRIPKEWQIAVDKDSEKTQYKNLEYPKIKPFYIEKEYMQIGLDSFDMNGIEIKIFDRDRTICDILRYKNKIEKEVFNNGIQKYLKDPKKNIAQLYKYSEELKVRSKVETYIGVWL